MKKLIRFPGGVVGVALDDDNRLTVQQVSGQALPACLLYDVLVASLGKEKILTEAEDLHRGRKLPWLVEAREGTSGRRDFLLRVMEREEWGWAPVMARAHVSMADKLNEGLRLWLGDLPPLLAEIAKRYPRDPALAGSLKAFDGYPVEGFNDPSAGSNLAEVIQAAEALEVLSS